MLKSLASGFRKHFTAMHLTLFLFGAFAVVWFYMFNRYTVLYYHEQMQLFRFDRFYFLSFLDRPGGLSEYLGAFLTQFYYYPLAGALILAAVVCSVVLLFYAICRSCGNIRQLFFIPFIPGVLLLTAFANIFFFLSAVVGILLALTGFRCYIALSQRLRYGAGMILVTATYFIAGGNALLLVVLILIFELTNRTQMTRITRISADNTNNSTDSQQYKNPRKSVSSALSAFKTSLYLLLLAGWAALLPGLSRHLFYTVTMREAYFALTPVSFISPAIDSKLLWISIPVLFLIGRLIVWAKSTKARKHEGAKGRKDEGAKTRKHESTKGQKGIALSFRAFAPSRLRAVTNFLLVAALTFGYIYFMYNDYRANALMRMDSDLQHGNFNSAIAVGKDYPDNNLLCCYITNIALYESGQMPYRMFHYKQLGTAGLFLDWELTTDYFVVWYISELNYRLGLILQAEHFAFESLVSGIEPDARVLQRLALTNIARRDAATANKYLRYLENSLFYRQWARQQRANLALAMAELRGKGDTPLPLYHVPDTPLPARCENFFIRLRMPEYTLYRLLEANPKHRMAFEYLMAYFMLERDIKNMKGCFDKYYGNFDYPVIPTHYEEALLLYKNVYNKGPEFFAQYPVSNATLERYDCYMQAVKAAQVSKSKKEQFKKQFGNTFWFYMNFNDPATSKK